MVNIKGINEFWGSFNSFVLGSFQVRMFDKWRWSFIDWYTEHQGSNFQKWNHATTSVTMIAIYFYSTCSSTYFENSMFISMKLEAESSESNPNFPLLLPGTISIQSCAFGNQWNQGADTGNTLEKRASGGWICSIWRSIESVRRALSEEIDVFYLTQDISKTSQDSFGRYLLYLLGNVFRT